MNKLNEKIGTNWKYLIIDLNFNLITSNWWRK